jgi:hypothetical protein
VRPFSTESHYLILAAAIASNLANGLDVLHAVKLACRYVEAGIKTSTDLGHGNGPINHFHSTYTLPFAPYVILPSSESPITNSLCSGRFIEYILDRPDVQKPWRGHTEHAFVAGLADGSLPVSAFKYYLIQDYLFLVCCFVEDGLIEI